MPMLRLTRDTIDKLGAETLPGFRFVWMLTELDDGTCNVPVNDEVALTIAQERLPGESDDDVVSRLVRAAMDQKPV